MAEKTDERIVTIPLRYGMQKKARNDRTKRAIYEIKEYALRHTGSAEVKVSKLVNETLWKRGKQKPQGKIKVKLSFSEDIARVMLPEEKEEIKAEEKKGAVASMKERITGKQERKELPKYETKAAPKSEAVRKPENKMMSE